MIAENITTGINILERLLEFIRSIKMGCGCRGGGRPRPAALGPSNNNNNNNNNVSNARKLRLTERPNSANPNVTGMTKEQRDTERKKRIQAIIVKRSGQ